MRSSVRPIEIDHVSHGRDGDDLKDQMTNTPGGVHGDDSSEMSRIENIPTAAFLRLEKTMRATTTMTLRPQTIMLAMFPSEPFVCTNGIPHSGFTPTGAVAGLADKPVRRVLSFWST